MVRHSAFDLAVHDLRVRLARLSALLRIALALLSVLRPDTAIPQAAFRSQTPDEVYFGRGDEIPDQLAEPRAEARERRMEANGTRRCAVCA